MKHTSIIKSQVDFQENDTLFIIIPYSRLECKNETLYKVMYSHVRVTNIL